MQASLFMRAWTGNSRRFPGPSSAIGLLGRQGFGDDDAEAVQWRRAFIRDFLALGGLFATIYGWFWFAAALSV